MNKSRDWTLIGIVDWTSRGKIISQVPPWQQIVNANLPRRNLQVDFQSRARILNKNFNNWVAFWRLSEDGTTQLDDSGMVFASGHRSKDHPT